MKPMYKLMYSISVFGFFCTACTKSPETLAKEYCKCKQNQQENCAELAESHFLQLQDEPELLQKYSAAVTECIITPPAK